MQANYDQTHGTITLTDGVVIYLPLVLNMVYEIDGKGITQPVEERDTGTNGAGNPLLLL